jgi:hypothetical protein
MTLRRCLFANRKRPVAISARSILRAGGGHKYWSQFSAENAKKIEALAAEFYQLLFEPEATEPIKTLDIPLGGSVSPVDALALLIEFLLLTGTRNIKGKLLSEYTDDTTGDETVTVLHNSLEVLKRITGNEPQSLGLHPAVYFYNEKGKYNRFMFLGIAQMLTDKLRNNDGMFFKKFMIARACLEKFLIDNKTLVSIVAQNLNKTQRVAKMRDMFTYIIDTCYDSSMPSIEETIKNLGLRGKILEIVSVDGGVKFSDEAKSMAFIKKALDSALVCPICRGKLDPGKSVSYDHIVRVRNGGTGNHENAQLTHQYCNTGIKN